MKITRGFFSTSKCRSESTEEMLSTRILLQSGQLQQLETGLFNKGHFLIRAQANMENLIRNILDRYDCVEVKLTILQPTSIWENSGRLNRYADSGELFIIPRTNNSNGNLCVAPTAEEAAIKYACATLKSYKDLPSTLYQITPKARNEARPRGGLLRTKEFDMKDAYGFYASEESMKQEYAKMKQAYLEIFKKLELDIIPVGALNGDIGGKFSEEFMFIHEKGGETLLVNEDNSLAFNKEILELDNASEYLKNFGIEDTSKLVEKRCMELGHIFQLGQSLTIPMKATFKDSFGHDIPYYMGCYGIGTNRLLMAICEATCDKEGLCWPKAIAPYKLHIIYKDDKKELAMKLYDDLIEHIPVSIDVRDNLRIGAKIKDWKLFGIPYLLIIGDQTSDNCFELESRKDGSKHFLYKSKLLDFLK